MGSKEDWLKAVGIGALIFGAGVFAIGGYTAATLVGVGTLTLGTVVTLVGASLYGAAVASELADMMGSEQYAGIKLQTHKSNINPTPFIYGVNKIGSNIIWQQTGEQVSGSDNKDYWSIQSISGHDLTPSGIIDMFANQDVMTSMGGGKYTLKYTHCKIHYFSKVNSQRLDLDDVDFVTLQDGTTQTGSDLGFTNFTLPDNIAFVSVHQVFEATDNAHVMLDNITVEIKGKTMPDVSATQIQIASSYSNNPARIVLDLLMDGLDVAVSDIDVDSFYQAKLDCDANNWSCNIAFVQQANIQSIIQNVLSTCRGQIVHSGNKWKLKIDTKSRSSTATLNDDDFINSSLSISMVGNGSIANKLLFKYVNPNDEWLSAQIEITDNDLYVWDGRQRITKTLDVKGCTNTAQAEVLAEIALNSMRYSEDGDGNRVKQTPLVLSFATTVKNAHLEVGDVITIDSELLDRNREFVILSVETDQSGLIQVSTREYCETHYKDTDGLYLI